MGAGTGGGGAVVACDAEKTQVNRVSRRSSKRPQRQLAVPSVVIMKQIRPGCWRDSRLDGRQECPRHVMSVGADLIE